MRLANFTILLGPAIGAGFGLALATGPTAAAAPDSIDDSWPYGVPGSFPFVGTTLPGFIEAGSATNGDRVNFGPITSTQADFNYTHTDGGSDEWYSVHHSTFVVPDLLTDEQQKVTDLLDPAAAYPTVGTVADHSELFSLSSPALQGVWLIQSYSLDDPNLGSASAFVLPGMANVFLGDDAGIKDIVNFFGQTFTLLDIPFATSGSAAASDLSDGMQQLMAEFTDVFPGADTLF